MINNLIDLGGENLYHGTVTPLPMEQCSIFNELHTSPLSESELELINRIADLTSDKEGARPILFSHTSSQNFTSETQPYYFCKTEADSLQISSHKLAIFMQATQENSCEITLNIAPYTTNKSCIKWSNNDCVNSFSTLKKIHLEVPKPILNKPESAGVYHPTENFLTSGVLVNYHLLNFKPPKKGRFFRLYWNAEKQKITGYFSLGDFAKSDLHEKFD